MLVKYFTDEQMKRIYEVIDSDKSNTKYLLLELIALTGARGGEIMECRFCDLDVSSMRLTIRHGSKNSEARTSLLSLDLVTRIVEARDALGLGSKDALQALMSRGSKETALRVLRSTFDKIQAKLWPGVEAPGIHGLRHTKARNAYLATNDIYMVQAVLGHKYISSTARYMPKVDESKLSDIQSKRTGEK